MEPQQFLNYWDVNYDELAELCGCSRSTVAHWFTSGKSCVPPTQDHKRRLAEIHAFWTLYENEPHHLREIYQRKQPRKKS